METGRQADDHHLIGPKAARDSIYT
jgi:hypothetical protein